MNLYDILLLCISLFDIVFSFFILFKSIKIKNKAGIIFSSFILLSGFWGLGNLFLDYSTKIENMYFWDSIAFAAPTIIALTFLLFNLVFTNRFKQLNLFLKIVLVIPIILIFLLSFSRYLVIDLTRYSWGVDPTYGPGYPIFLIYFFSYMAISFYLIIKEYKTEKGIRKSQLLYFLIGTSLSAIIGISTNIIYPIITGYSRISKIGPACTIIMIIFIGYAILRYRLMDIRVIFKKSIVYGFIFIIILFTSILIALFLKDVLYEQLAIDPTISIVVLMMIMIFIFPGIKNYIQKELDKIFKKDYIDFSEKIDKLEKAVSSHTQVNDLAKEISESMKDLIKVDQVEFFVIDRRQNEFVSQFPQNENKLIKNGLFTALNDGKEVIIKEELNYLKPKDRDEKKRIKDVVKSLEKLNSSAALPIFTGTELIGIILMGSKEGNRNFTSEDLELMKQVSGKIGDILGNVLLYKEAVERIQYNQQQT